MCGRYAIDSKVNEAITAYVHAGGRPQDWRPSDWDANYNVAPTNTSVIVVTASTKTPGSCAGRSTGTRSGTSGRPG